MTTPLWKAHFETEADKLETEVEHRREVTAHDPVAAGIEWAAKRLRRAIDQLDNELQFLTPAQWGAMQPKRIPEQTVRRWIRNGELESIPGPRGSLVPRGALRVRRVGASHLALTGS
ncbi:hypothetical protein [Gemmatimonas sp.]